MSVEIKVVDHTGGVFATLTDMVSLEPLRCVLNKPGSMRFGLHNLDPFAAAVHAIEREVQVWLDGALVAGEGWLVPIRPEATMAGEDDVVEFECRGLQWYFDRRFVGDADRKNYIDNGGFEDPTLGPWTAVGVTATRDTTRRINGAAAAKLVQASAGTDTYIEQTVTITAGGVGALLTFAGWFYVASTGYVGEAFGGRGLFIQRSVGGVVADFDFAPYATDADGNVPLDAWQRRKVTVQMPPNATEDISVRGMAVGGTTWLDELTLTAMDSISYYETDQATIADALVAHAQDPTYGKSDLLIGRSTPPTGITRTRHYQHAEHDNIATALDEFPGLEDGFDQSIETDGVNRTYTIHFPRKGTSRPALDWDEITSLRWVPVEGEKACSSVVVLGEGDGPDREEGAAIDATAYGGVTLEEVLSCSPGAAIDSLDSTAAEELRLRKTARRLEVTLCPDTRLTTMAVGDTFDGPAAAHGYVDLSGTWRAVETALDLVDRCLTITAEAA